jgi:hypothetical protein
MRRQEEKINKGCATRPASNGLVPGQSITINNLGAFYNSSGTTNLGGMKGGTPAAQAYILLHEIAHLINGQGGAAGFGDDYQSTKKGDANDRLLNKNCAKTIGGL